MLSVRDILTAFTSTGKGEQKKIDLQIDPFNHSLFRWTNPC